MLWAYNQTAVQQVMTFAARPTCDHTSEVARVQWLTVCIAVIFRHFSWSTQYCGIPANMVSVRNCYLGSCCDFQTSKWMCFHCAKLLLKNLSCFFFLFSKRIGRSSHAFACGLAVSSPKCLVAFLVEKYLMFHAGCSTDTGIFCKLTADDWVRASYAKKMHTFTSCILQGQLVYKPDSAS